MKIRNHRATKSDGRPPAVSIPPEDSLSPLAKVAKDLFLRFYVDNIGPIRVVMKRKSFVPMKSIRDIAIILSSKRKGRSGNESPWELMFKVITAVNRIPVVELPETMDEPHSPEKSEPTSMRRGLRRSAGYLLNINRHAFPPGFLLSADPSAKQTSCETLRSCGWNGQRLLLGVLLENGSCEDPRAREIPRRMAFLAGACDRRAHEDNARIILFLAGETGKRLGKMFMGFSRIRPLVVDVTNLSIPDRMGLVSACRAVVITGRPGEIIAAASSTPAVAYSLSEKKTFRPEVFASRSICEEADLMNGVRAVLYDDEIRKSRVVAATRAGKAAEESMLHWLRSLVARYRLTG